MSSSWEEVDVLLYTLNIGGTTYQVGIQLDSRFFTDQTIGIMWSSPRGITASTLTIIPELDASATIAQSDLVSDARRIGDIVVKPVSPESPQNVLEYAINHNQFLDEYLTWIPYVSSELKRGSAVLQSMNDEFRKYSDDVELWSLYETQKLTVGPIGVLIVDPSPATLGYREEHQIPLNADHRSVCKFETRTDSNYITARNALALAVSRLSKQLLKSREITFHSQIKDPQKYLDVPECPEDDLALVEDARMTGTCEWPVSKPTFVEWNEFDLNTPKFLWVNAKPGTGKTVLTGHAIQQLRNSPAPCSFYFFKHGEKRKSRLVAVTQILCGDAAEKIIVSTRQSDHLWNISGEEQSVRVLDQPGVRKWFQHQQSLDLAVCLCDRVARIYKWGDWSEVAVIDLTIDLIGLQMKSVIPCVLGNKAHLLLELSELDGSPHGCEMVFAHSQGDSNKDISRDSSAALMQSLSRRMATIGHHVAHIIGLRGPDRVVFLDTRSWISSAGLDKPEDSQILYARHFFVPHEWFSGMSNIVLALNQGDLLIARNSDLAIVKGGLEHTQVVGA
ncbi:hypothetical protein BO71DRAFT_435948 [Aspergillus ellipticus CBS 707.79]|uniref:Nephrocystin 3-like N-terminal domain-containing protein n=1 Tax=Aspergillus ellipticus CBS 707.79 TaxID=1448320 RepID=A0A319DJG2_9EURO|nr:hypothetical protein BO71DRAFT_435948 [Aspergillus ellipticus CBS 707.79]